MVSLDVNNSCQKQNGIFFNYLSHKETAGFSPLAKQLMCVPVYRSTVSQDINDSEQKQDENFFRKPVLVS
jgi:hypothetical protein